MIKNEFSVVEYKGEKNYRNFPDILQSNISVWIHINVI
jgi:hypothetical protein